MQNARKDDFAPLRSAHDSSSFSASSPIGSSSNSLFSSSRSNPQRQAGTGSRSGTDSTYAFRQSVLDMDALLTFTDNDRDADDVFDPVLPASKPRFKRPFGMSGERLFNQQLKSIGHAQDPSPTVKPFDVIHIPDEPVYQRPPTADDTLALLLPLLILLSTLLFLLLLFIILVIVVRRRARISLGDSDGPLDVGREEELEGTGGLDGIEQRWLETVEEPVQRGYRRAKDWILAYPPGTQSTDITLSQFLSIQEKGVSAWSFDPDYESNPSVFVEARTEITFIADGEGMAPQEGGGVCVQSNLPLPKINEVYYWEVKMFNKPDTTNVAVGLTTKPYPQFRLPGWSKYSIGYFSSDGFKCHNYPFAAQSYGPAYGQGDVIGIGYRPRTGTVFFTRNGKRLEDAFIGLNRYNLFPTVGADGACEIHVNLGQAGFVFIEANVKKWGLAPMVGTLAPPPAYGQERGTILMESGQGSSADANGQASSSTPAPRSESPPPPISPYEERSPSQSHNRLSSQGSALSPAPVRTSSLHPNRAALDAPRATSRSLERDDSSDGSPPNPPTPHRLDISLHSLSDASTRGSNGAVQDSYFPASPASPADALPPPATSNHSPPSYAAAVEHGSLGGTSASHHQARRGSGRTHQLANAVLGMLSDRGLLQPINHNNPSPQPSPNVGGSGYGGYGSGHGGGLSEAEYERMLRQNTARNSRSGASTGSSSSAAAAADYSLQGWANWLGLRVGGNSNSSSSSSSASSSSRTSRSAAGRRASGTTSTVSSSDSRA
ncbi:Protein EAR1 [Pseudozyma hubeiensis]|nr:Protein EAR1 [Pseudozyma hubeiensis]